MGGRGTYVEYLADIPDDGDVLEPAQPGLLLLLDDLLDGEVVPEDLAQDLDFLGVLPLHHDALLLLLVQGLLVVDHLRDLGGRLDPPDLPHLLQVHRDVLLHVQVALHQFLPPHVHLAFPLLVPDQLHLLLQVQVVQHVVLRRRRLAVPRFLQLPLHSRPELHLDLHRSLLRRVDRHVHRVALELQLVSRLVVLQQCLFLANRIALVIH